ncbi:MAG: TldD/PmbA family protein [Bdellovibrionales bacterium]|nr:TldD/PmbA family protein [Bdellovibrionales bacterium]
MKVAKPSAEALSKLLQEAESPSWKKAQWIGLREVSETTTSRSVRDGFPEQNQAFSSRGWMVEVLVQGQFAYVATPARSVESLRAAVDRAMARAESASRYGVFKFTAEQRPPTRGQYQSPFLKDASALRPGQVNDFLIRVCQALKVSPEIVRTEAMLRMVETDFAFASTNGAAWTQNFLLSSTHYGVVSQKDGQIQRRSDNGSFARSRQMGMETLDESDLDRARVVGNQALELLSAPNCPTGPTELVLSSDQMMLQIHESIGHPLEIDRILGDERNYAGSSFVKLSDFGKLQYGSKHLNVSFDPGYRGEFASYRFDDSGAEAKKEYIIRDGLLLRGLGGLESQARSSAPGVSNFRSCSWNRPPIDRMANLNLEPGTVSFDQIIGSIDDGVYMESNLSWSIDDYRNKFQFGCEYGRRIRGGKLAEVVRNPNYRGVSTPFWNSLKQVGNSQTVGVWGTPYCGKGEPNQIIRVGHASPVCHFSGVEVFGGEK